MTVLKFSHSALDVVVSCLVAQTQTHWGRALNTWRLQKAPRRTPCFDISLYFSLYFSSLQLMAVGAVTAQAWWRFALSTPHLVSRTDWHALACVCARGHTRKHTLNTLPPALVNPRLPLPVYKSKGHRAGGGAAGGYDSYDTLFWSAVI